MQLQDWYESKICRVKEFKVISTIENSKLAFRVCEDMISYQ